MNIIRHTLIPLLAFGVWYTTYELGRNDGVRETLDALEKRVNKAANDAALAEKICGEKETAGDRRQ